MIQILIRILINLIIFLISKLYYQNINVNLILQMKTD